MGQSVSSLPPLSLSNVLRANLKRAEKKTNSPNTSFWTTVSPHDAFSAPLARSEYDFLSARSVVVFSVDDLGS